MNDDIFWFDISVYDPQGMDFVDSFTNLLDDRGYFGLLHGLGSLQLMEKLPACSHLENDVDVAFIIEVAVHLYDVWVVEIELYFQLSYELIGDFFVFYQFFLDHFQCTDKSCIFLSKIR